MYEITQLLKAYIRGVKSLTGADRATLFVPSQIAGPSQALLIDDGEDPPIDELASLDTARKWIAESALDSRATLDDNAPPLLLPGRQEGAVLLPLASLRGFWSGGLWPSDFFRLRGTSGGRRRTDSGENDSTAAWLGLRFTAGRSAASDSLVGSLLSGDAPGDQAPKQWEWLLSLGGALAGHASHISAILTDPITGLPDRTGFQAILSEALEKGSREGDSFSLLLINPDDFAMVNETLGREQGDEIIREVADRLRATLRSSDPVARYGGVIFAVVLPATDRDWAAAVAEKALDGLSTGPYLGGAVRLGFSIGYSVFDPGSDKTVLPAELFGRADQALNSAKRMGGSCVVEWHSDLAQIEAGACDRLSGIFTGDVSKDYRNMVLLWDTIDAIARSADFKSLTDDVVGRLFEALRPSRLGLFMQEDGDRAGLRTGLTRLATDTAAQHPVRAFEPSGEDLELLQKAIRSARPETLETESGLIAHAIPLLAGGEAVGALYLAGSRDQLPLDESDLIFLRALAAQVAVALDRARLATLEDKRRDNERRELESQLNDLRRAMRRAKMIYQSAEMEEVLERAGRVAPTDATVLITGESGTGKELLAKTVHELSPRRRKPMVVVDCVGIATTLMESELFGHEKGAYTGAQGRRVGRLAEAEGGTVLLDEIGELPLEVQSKLLRFVQEKQFTPVGGSRPKSVDVRILAATNRDLASEVERGTFREDLYYRLNVVSLHVPALRHRPDDILHLARYFLDSFSLQYQKPVRRFTSDAETAMRRYSWPGNIRELQNRIMQAVILCQHDEIGTEEIQLAAVADAAIAIPRETSPSASASTASEQESRTDGEDSWARLRSLLNREIDAALSDKTAVIFPLGLWLREDFVLEAHAAGGGIARKGAALLGIPETTYRRQLAKAQESVKAGLSPRSQRWHETRSVVRQIIDATVLSEHQQPIKRASRILLQEILEKLPSDTSRGSRLLAVTPPTFRTRMAELRKTVDPAPDAERST